MFLVRLASPAGLLVTLGVGYLHVFGSFSVRARWSPYPRDQTYFGPDPWGKEINGREQK